MTLLKQLWILILLYFLGEITANLIPSPLPGNVLGFIYLFFALKIGIVKSSAIEDVSNFLLKNLAILFIPGGVKIITVSHLFEGNLVKIVLIVIISTILAMLGTAGTILLLEKVKK